MKTFQLLPKTLLIRQSTMLPWWHAIFKRILNSPKPYYNPSFHPDYHIDSPRSTHRAVHSQLPAFADSSSHPTSTLKHSSWWRQMLSSIQMRLAKNWTKSQRVQEILHLNRGTISRAIVWYREFRRAKKRQRIQRVVSNLCWIIGSVDGKCLNSHFGSVKRPENIESWF